MLIITSRNYLSNTKYYSKIIDDVKGDISGNVNDNVSGDNKR